MGCYCVGDCETAALTVAVSGGADSAGAVSIRPALMARTSQVKQALNTWLQCHFSQQPHGALSGDACDY